MLQLLQGFQLLENGPTAICISRLSDGLMLQANQAFLTLTGYTREEAIGATGEALNLWDKPGERLHMAQAVRSAGFKFNLAIDLRHKSGVVVPVLGSAHALETADGTCLLTLLNDLREVDGFVPRLAKERAHLDFVEVSAKIGFWNHDHVAQQLHWSHGMEAIYGLPRGGFKGTSEDALQRVHPDDLARYQEERQQAVERAEPFEMRFRIVRTDGVVRWVVSRGAVRCGGDGAFQGACGFQVDNTDEMERKQLMRLQAQVMQNMAEGVLLVCAQSGSVLYANPRFEQMLGYASGKLVGLPVADLNARSEQDPVEVANAIMAQLRQHGQWRGEVKNRCADGREIWTSCTVSGLQYEGLGLIWVAVHSDINDRRLAQIARDEALAQLRRLSFNLQDSIEQERRALSRDVHDQLGAALTGMRMKMEALAGQLAAGMPVHATDLLAVAQTARSTQLAAREICTRLRPQMLDDMGLVEACRWYLKDWSAQVGIAASGRFARLRCEPDAKLAIDLFRVMQELMTNVARHAGATRLMVSLSGSAGELQLRLKDDGHGFAPEQDTGGFGLMGIRERVRHHDGQLHIESGSTGTTVTVRMGLARSA